MVIPGALLQRVKNEKILLVTMKNNAHSESREKRTKRFQDGPPIEIILTLLNSIDNHFNNEIRLTAQGVNYQTTLMFLGIHAVALTISGGFFNKNGVTGYKLFLEKFVDGDTLDTKFSNIADLLHNWRNILAHQWLGLTGHILGYDYEMQQGYRIEEEVTIINPKVYLEHYLKAFEAGGKIWSYREYLDDSELDSVKDRLLKKFLAK